jgi:hypothetical protein
VGQSGWPDSNRRSRAPKARGVPLPYIPRCVSGPYGNRTRLSALKGRYPLPIDERAMSCAHRVRKVGQEALESSSADFQSAAVPSQLPTHDRKGIAAHFFAQIAERRLGAVSRTTRPGSTNVQNEKGPMP